jgi:hypothetical protein
LFPLIEVYFEENGETSPFPRNQMNRSSGGTTMLLSPVTVQVYDKDLQDKTKYSN